MKKTEILNKLGEYRARLDEGKSKTGKLDPTNMTYETFVEALICLFEEVEKLKGKIKDEKNRVT